MKKLLRQLLGESVVYGLSGVIVSLIQMFLVPIYTRIFDPKDYGVISVLSTTSNLLAIALMFGLDNSAAAWFWEKPEPDDRRRTFSSWVGFLGAVSFGVAALFVVGSTLFTRLVFDAAVPSRVVTLWAVGLFFVGFHRVANTWFRSIRKPVYAIGYSLTVSLTTVLSNLLLVVKLRMGLLGIFISQATSGAVGFGLMAFLLRDQLSLRYFDRTRLREMIVFSAPLVPAALLYWLMNSASAYFLNAFCSRSEVGLYQVAGTISSVLALGTFAFLQAWAPFALSIARDPMAKSVIATVTEVFIVGGLAVAFFFCAFAPEALRLFTNEKYLAARYVVGILAINIIALGVPQILASAFTLAKKNGPFARSMVVGAVFTTVLFVILVPRWGKEGAALAVLFGNLLVPVHLFSLAQKVYPLPIAFGRLARNTGMVAAFIGTALYLDRSMSFGVTLIALKATLALVLVALLVGLYRRRVLEALRREI